MQQLALPCFGRVEPLRSLRDDRIAKTSREQPVAKCRKIRVPADLAREPRGGGCGRGEHQFQVAHVLAGGARHHLGQHVPGSRGCRPELAERRKEMIVAVERSIPIAHRHRIDRLIEERRILQHVHHRRAAGARVARSHHDHHRGRDETRFIVRRPAQITLGIDRTGQMVVQVAAFRHLTEKREQLERLIADGREPARGCRLGSRGARPVLRLSAEDDRASDDRNGQGAALERCARRPDRLRQGYGGPPKLYAEAEGLRHTMS